MLGVTNAAGSLVCGQRLNVFVLPQCEAKHEKHAEAQSTCQSKLAPQGDFHEEKFANVVPSAERFVRMSDKLLEVL